MSENLPPAAAIVSHTCSDVDQWKAAFDSDEPARRAAGILGHHINHAADDSKQITIFMAMSDLEKGRAFVESPELAAAMRNGGILGPPTVSWVTPVREAIDWNRQLPAFILSHRVADFDTWLTGYDAVGQLQKSKGIIGQAANRSLDDPSLAIVFHQAESFDTLRSFLADPEVQSTMKAVGVISEPEVTFTVGGWGKQY